MRFQIFDLSFYLFLPSNQYQIQMLSFLKNQTLTSPFQKLDLDQSHTKKSKLDVSFEFLGLITGVGYCSLGMPLTLTSSPATLKISSANSHQVTPQRIALQFLAARLSMQREKSAQ